MNLGLFLSIGESLSDLEKKGQLKRLVNYNIKKYSQNFDKVYIFTYENESGYDLPKNCNLISNKRNLNRFIYSVLLPIMNIKSIQDCNVFRGLQLTGGIPAILVKLMFRKNFVVNYGYDYSKIAKIEQRTIQSIIYKFVELPILILASKVIVTSKEVRKTLRKKYDNNKLALIPNGVDTNLFRPLKRIQNKKLTVLYIGRLEIQKNLENLLFAIENIKQVKVIFVGTGSQKDKLLTIAKKLNIEIEIQKATDYEELPKVLAKADIFVLPSLLEGNPKVLLEAMSCGLAVLGSNVEGIRELITNGKTGLICSTKVNSIRRKLVKLQNIDLRNKLGLNARRFVIHNYEMSVQLTNEINLLLKLAK